MDTDRFKEDSPPRRSGEQLETWVQEFLEQGHAVAGSIRVVPQEGVDGQDTGLVIVDLRNSTADVYIQPLGYDEPLWAATLTPQDEELALSSYVMASLAAELVVASNLCAFLQFKSLDWDRNSGKHGH